MIIRKVEASFTINTNAKGRFSMLLEMLDELADEFLQLSTKLNWGPQGKETYSAVSFKYSSS